MLKEIEFNLFILNMKETWPLREWFVQGLIVTAQRRLELASVRPICFLTL